jgi:HK97 family phage portal protein
MGILSALKIVRDDKIEAQYAPAIMDLPLYGNSYWNGGNVGQVGIDRMSAAQVPALLRCRNLICGIIGSIPLELYSKSTGAELTSPPWLDQPDIRQPRSQTIAWTIDSLIFYGVSFWEVTEVNISDGRPARFAWVQNTRVSTTLDAHGTEVLYYSVSGVRRPMSGTGSLVTFQSFTNGILNVGARTIQAALDLEKAASVSTQTAMPTGIIRNNGADLPETQVQGLLASWKASRNNRSTAYLTSTLEYIPTSFSPKEMTYVESIQSYALQIARMMNVPASMIDAQIMQSQTYQNILDGRKEFMAYTLQPYISVIEDRLSLDDLTPRTSEVKFAVDETFLRVDAKSRLDILEQMLTLGLITTDQAMAMEQLTPSGQGEGTNEINIQ